MTAQYPSEIATLTNPISAEGLNQPTTGVPHSVIETRQNEEILAIETELGTGLKGSKSSLAERIAVGINEDGTLKSEAISIESLSDVTLLSGLSNGQLLYYNASLGEWINWTPDFNLASLGDVDATDKAEGKILQVDSLGKHVYVTNTGGTDEKVKYDTNDTTAGYLSDKILAGTGISLSEGTGTDKNKLIITNTSEGAIYTAGSGIDITDKVVSNTGVIAETDPVFTSSQASNITQTDITNLSNLSGSNSGDQESSDFSLEDLSDVVKTAKATGKILQVNSSGTHEYVDLPDPDVSGLVPYTGATTDVDLGNYDLTATDATIEGNVYISNSKFIKGRNYANTANVDTIKVNEDDNIEIGADLEVGDFILEATSEPATPEADSKTIYVTANGTTPNRQVVMKIKDEAGQEVILSSLIV